ncbi:MAG: PEPxxWA-CTERM sorting domain-containing protein [Novosphingobium sp.]|nr:PEPxxWA-CTERM sorting domain-containing protein [Novosphingobium sp.]
MRKLVVALAGMASLGCASVAWADILPTLQSVTPNGDGTYKWLYQGTVTAKESLLPGDRLVIYDFAGLVGALINPYAPNVAASAQLVTSPDNTALANVGASDNPGLFNLVFTYEGAPLNTNPATATTLNFDAIGANSTFSLQSLGAYTAITHDNQNGGLAANQGHVSVPSPLPEPATWALMMLGFGAIGLTMRKNREPKTRLRFGVPA